MDDRVKPKRVQQRRVKGWRMPVNARSCARPGPFGNPFRIGRIECPTQGGFCWVVVRNDYAIAEHIESEARARTIAVLRFWEWINGPSFNAVALRARMRAELAGLDLACFCPENEPCHVDVVLEVANS